jgi:nucleoid-associated protein YgaU
MDRFEESKHNYASVFALVQRQGVRLAQLQVHDNKLFIRGPRLRKQSRIRCGTASGIQRTYTVKPGDSLSKIAKNFYGNANDHIRIFEANRNTLSDPNEIQPGQELVISGWSLIDDALVL